MEKSVLERLESSKKRWIEVVEKTEQELKDATYSWGFVDCLTDIIERCKDEGWVRTKTETD